MSNHRYPDYNADNDSLWFQLFNETRAVIFVCSREGVIQEVNKSCERYLGESRNTLMGMRIQEIVIEEDREKFLLLFHSSTQETIFWEINFLTRDQDTIMLNCYNVNIGGRHVLVAREGDPSVLRLQEELMTINNEMINLYRELEQKNKQLARMNETLEKQKSEIQAKNHLIRNQLRLAQRIQQHIISKENQSMYNLDFYFNYLPANDIGGDYYDVVDLKNGKVGVFISDVSGHGISAALITMIVKMLFLNQQEKYSNPDQLMDELNREFYQIFGDGFEDTYCTAFYCVIDTHSMTISYCNAGHPTPVTINRDTADEISQFNLPIGFFGDTKFVPGQVSLTEEDKLLFLTDGLSDLLLKYQINKVDTLKFFEKLKDKHMLNVASGGDSPDDDISLILVEVKKEKSEEECRK